MSRIKFDKGKQRDFIQKVINETEMPSLRALLTLGISTNYSTLKNYYNESRVLPDNLFEEFLILAGFKRVDFSFKVLEDNWGRVKGGRKGKRK